MSGSDSTPYISPQPNYTYSFYAITGQRLATLNCNGSNYPAYPVCSITGQNVYFGRKLIVVLRRTQAYQHTSVRTLTTTLNPGSGSAASTTSTQNIDDHGNLTQLQISDYTGSPTGSRTYNMMYTASYTGYPANYIFNRLVSATVTPNGGSPYPLSSTTYDTDCLQHGLTLSSAVNNHDSNYGTSLIYRGNPSWVYGLNGADGTCTAFDTAGIPYFSANLNGQSVSVGTDATTNFSLPISISPNGNSGMVTTATYASSWAPLSMSGPNNDTGATAYDSYGRPYTTTIPDGATTTYAYTYYNPVTQTGANTQTATVDGRWQTTTLDGFGRTIQVQKGNGSTVVSTVQTQYAPCACSPLGKMSAVSQPYAPNATAYWTTYTYDGSGRPLTVTAPDGASTTQYSYAGYSTTVTDPAGKWKKSTVDAYGNLILLTEPKSGRGTDTTSYTYTVANQLTGVSMTRGSVAQTRTFLYTGSDLVSATNPENGTVTYVYDSSHHVTSRTDAIGQKTVYTYDSYGRLSEVQYFDPSNNEYTKQRVTYYYDGTYPCTFTPSNQHGTGRMTGVAFGGGMTDAYHDSYCYMYEYNTAGRVTTQAMKVTGAYSYYNNINFSAGYQWDTEGRMTSLQYPTVTAYGSFGNMPVNMPTAGFQYDTNGRLSEMTMDDHDGHGPQWLANATYTAPGQLYQLFLGGWAETRSYNTLGQLTSQIVPSVLNMTYNYSATANNGRIASSVDGITGETTTYGYDVLNRLTSATNSQWSESYGYDGFGNLTSKAGTGGSPNPAPSMSVSYNAKNQPSNMYFDANGNGGGWTYSVENKMVWQTLNYQTEAANLYAYDPSGKRVMSGSDSNPYTSPQPNYTYSFYAITGQRLATLNCNGSNYPAYPVCSITGQNVYFGRKLIVSGGVNVVTDRLGTVRANGQGESFAYYPYGEERTSTVDKRDKFGTYFRDSVGQDYADQRYYNAGMGRFWSPDPGGRRTANRRNPLSWNRYAYVNGDPVNRFDPRGREDAAPGDGGCTVDDNGDIVCTGYADGGGGGTGGDSGSVDTGEDTSDSNDADPDGDPQSNQSSTTQNQTPPAAQSCGQPQTGLGIGLTYAGSAEAGVAGAGASVQASTGQGVFYNNSTGASTGGFLSGGATAYSGSSNVGAPKQQTPPFVLGGYAGYGPGLFFTNAGSPNQLSGPFTTITLNIGFGLLQGTVSFGFSNGIGILSISGGTTATGAAGIGASASVITTSTATSTASGCH